MSGPAGAANNWPQPSVGAAPNGQPQYQQQHYDQNQHHQQYSSYPPPQQVPIFQVSTMRHTGALIFWFNQRYVITGTYDQCDAALRSAQIHNVVFGWWSFLSILLMNWVAIISNSSSRRKLKADVQQAQEYAQWWHQYVGPHRA